ncbi:MAG: hypothetical protein V4476_15530 [Pseudomonadota bacterium]
MATSYTYTVVIPTSFPTPPEGCGNAAIATFTPGVPVNLTTCARQFSAGDTITFVLDHAITAATMFCGVSADSTSPVVSPFTNVSSSFSIMPVDGKHLTVTVSTTKGAWQLWCQLSTRPDFLANFYIADPEVQTQTGGTPPHRHNR